MPKQPMARNSLSSPKPEDPPKVRLEDGAEDKEIHIAGMIGNNNARALRGDMINPIDASDPTTPHGMNRHTPEQERTQRIHGLSCVATDLTRREMARVFLIRVPIGTHGQWRIGHWQGVSMPSVHPSNGDGQAQSPPASQTHLDHRMTGLK
jgi:hypothetical protein